MFSWHQHWVRYNLVHDSEWASQTAGRYMDFQNCYEALWFGGDLRTSRAMSRCISSLPMTGSGLPR